MRSRKIQKIARIYQSNPENGTCALCEHTFNETILETDNFMVLNNIAPYDWWDMHYVDTHYLVVPHAHIKYLDELNDAASIEYMEIIKRYGRKGFSVYSRAQQNNARTEIHLHTHLIKTGRLADKFLFFLKKPYLFFFK